MIAETKTHKKSWRTKRVARVRVFAVKGEDLGGGRARQGERSRVELGLALETAPGAKAVPVARLRRFRGGTGLLWAWRRCAGTRATPVARLQWLRGGAAARCGREREKEHAAVVARRLGEQRASTTMVDEKEELEIQLYG
jgi:hypothetical protein